VEGKVGAIGRMPSFLRHRFAFALVKFNPASGKPVRDTNGRCLHCAIEETGEAIGRIRGAASQRNDPGSDFEGYSSAKDTERKIIHDVFEPGDAWYRSGDLMRMDAAGYFYFVDRMGDTFRWKGENIAASQVANVVMTFPGVREACVYGVRIARNEGAAAMAALVVDGPLDLGRLRHHLARELPRQARPLFLRLTDRFQTTATFKQSKVDFVRTGFDPAATKDPIYFDHPKQRTYIPLDAALYARIQSGKIRL
jgi:fatty-acyl-CoA synthase